MLLALHYFFSDEKPPSPKLNSTLQGVSACPGERHQFVCTLYSHSIVWRSDEYIGDHMMEISSSLQIGTPLHDSRNIETYAVLERAEQVNGGLQLTSMLTVVILPSLREQNHTVTCLNRDLGTQQSMTFQISGT